MAEIIGVRFKSVGKIYYFAPGNEKVENGQKVIVETARGVECGTVVVSNREVPDSELSAPLKPVIRIATEKDLETVKENKKKEEEAFKICEEKIAKHKLDMKLLMFLAQI